MTAPATLRLGRFALTLDRPLVMGVVNVTPDSFSDGGRFVGVEAAVAHAQALVREGADLLDVGGESTRPGSLPVDAAEELRRVIPVIEGIVGLGVPVSVDTTKPAVMRAAVASGAAMVNDILALRTPGAIEAVAASGAGVCLMHMQGEPRTMQANPTYSDVVAEVRAFLAARVAACEAAGIARDRVVVDPGFGFGKTAEHNLALLRGLAALGTLRVPVLAGLSRKSTLGQITGRPIGERLAASVAAALLAAERGAKILRVHDVAATRDALAVLNAVEDVRPRAPSPADPES
ncbi:MAG: dihydropteroate synthase [Burkholderiales bacterium]|jgi:dihydropteroate synthase|nr:dihydropteroate synthase [Burkholderiales bacterium]